MTESGVDVRVAGKGRRAGPLWWGRPRSAVLDVALAVASAAECAAQGVPFARETGVPVLLGVLLGVVAGSTVVLRRRYPIAVVLVAIAVTPAQMGFVLGTVGLYTLAASDVPRRIIVLLSGMQAVGIFVVSYVLFRPGGVEADMPGPRWFLLLMAALLSLVATVPPVLFGLYVGARRRLVDALRERADGLERELSLLAERAEERAEWARNEERTRIAREMHDVVAHRVSLMVVHAAALQAVALKDPAKASRNAALVGDMGRQALSELRTMLGVLRSHEVSAEGSRAASGASGPERDGDGGGRPLEKVALFAAAAAERDAASGPRLGELEQLVGQSRAAGMVVELSVEGVARPYPAAVEQTAFRVVQEALTNVHKHAAGARTRVRLAHRGAEVAVQVENEAAAAGVADAGLPSGGNGLVGMRERVTALGGGFVSGPTAAGGFRVSAVIPDRSAR
ncbi:histidine kinase [Streptomyces sp. TRM 70351]|uniref:sensor histidine kinase n=1 Tax=Streptomyces sp. TRM 70351 TaxID=3116552 RepID=UPI002E7B2659|nr:histidine kinase [Streptomyces sp. TRM 70351]MEE1929436.1 histidine kinase [Streptomyces sp. TRM 70351]